MEYPICIAGEATDGNLLSTWMSRKAEGPIRPMVGQYTMIGLR